MSHSKQNPSLTLLKRQEKWNKETSKKKNDEANPVKNRYNN